MSNADRWSHICTDGQEHWCKRETFCGICRAYEPDGLGHHGPKDRDRTLHTDLIAEGVEELLFLQMTGPEGNALDTVLTALRAAEAENMRLREALEQIDRMHLMPDDKINRTTHAMALVIARRALGGEP
jgi:hypothetical protein